MIRVTPGPSYFSAGARCLPEEPTAISEELNTGDKNSGVA